MAAEQLRTTRFESIDALRGVAALMVLAFHLFRSTPMAAELAGITPGEAATLLDASRNGVAVFFVISGFVIAWTTRDLGSRPPTRATTRGAGSYVSTRPTTSMIAVVVLASLAEHWIPGLEYRSITVAQVVANLLYVQGFTGRNRYSPSPGRCASRCSSTSLSSSWRCCWAPQPSHPAARPALSLPPAVGCSPPRCRLVQPSLHRHRSRAVVHRLVVDVLRWDGPRLAPRRPALVARHGSRVGGPRCWCLVVDLWAPSSDPFHGQWAAWVTASSSQHSLAPARHTTVRRGC